MKRILYFILLAFCIILLVGCAKNSPSNDPLNITTLEQVKQYFTVNTKVVATTYGFNVDVSLTPKRTVKVDSGATCIVWVKVDYYYKVNQYTFLQTDFYIGVNISLSSSGYGSGVKNEYRGVVIVSASLQNWYDVKNINIKLLDY